MAKKKQPQSSDTADRHASNYMLRLPEKYRQGLKRRCAKTRRTMTEEAKIALEEYLTKHGDWQPGEEDGPT